MRPGPGRKTGPGCVASKQIPRPNRLLSSLGTDHLDLYLLHWPSRDADLSSIVAAFESLRTTGKIRAWGVSNFKVSDMEALFHVPNGNHCATNQVLYNIGSRSIEYDLLPWCEQRGMPVRAARPAVPSGYEHPQRRAFSVPRATGRPLAALFVVGLFYQSGALYFGLVDKVIERRPEEMLPKPA